MLRAEIDNSPALKRGKDGKPRLRVGLVSALTTPYNVFVFSPTLEKLNADRLVSIC
jgi:hypothetical protein